LDQQEGQEGIIAQGRQARKKKGQAKKNLLETAKLELLRVKKIT
jgi:hypothetical protein